MNKKDKKSIGLLVGILVSFALALVNLANLNVISSIIFFILGICMTLYFRIFMVIIIMLSFNSVKSQDFWSYYSISGGYSSLGDKTLSLEVGCWGVEKPVMYGASFDYMNVNSLWVGVKPCYQLTGSKGYYLFTYFCPKINVVKPREKLIEFGLMNYTKVTKNFYTSAGLGLQSSKEYNLIPSFMFGVNLVL